MCLAVSAFIETNDLIKFQFRSKLPRAKAARFFPFFTPGIRPPSWKLASLLWNSWVTSAKLEGRLDRIRRWIAEATRQIHVPYHPFSCGSEMDCIRRFSLHRVNYYLRWEILTFTNSPDDSSPPASYINAKKTSDQTYTPKFVVDVFCNQFNVIKFGPLFQVALINLYI